MHEYAELHVDLLVVSMKVTLNKDFAYAMTPMKILSWPVGTWPLQDYNIFSAMRVIITSFLLVRNFCHSVSMLTCTYTRRQGISEQISGTCSSDINLHFIYFNNLCDVLLNFEFIDFAQSEIKCSFNFACQWISL